MKELKVINLSLIVLVIAIFIIGFTLLGCHHNVTPNPPPVVDNPANYTYTAALIATYQPGFFSCCKMPNALYLGSYMDYNHKHEMQAQLCRLDENKVTKLRTVRGSESIYNITPIDKTSMFLSCEQGPLLGSDLAGKVWTIHVKTLDMGAYWTDWWEHDGKSEWVTTEKDTINTSNKSRIWINGKLLYESSDFTWKEGVIIDDTMYISAYFIWKHKEGGLLTVNLKTGEPNLVYSEPDTACYALGKYNGAIYYGLQHNAETRIFKYPHTFIQTIPDIAWRFRQVDDTFFLTAAEHGWRKDGPSYLYVLNTDTGKFIKKLQLSDVCEPWDIDKGPTANTYYLVSRCEKGNIGKVFLVTKH